MLKRGMLLSFILIVALFLFSCQSPVKTETTPETPAETAPSGCTAHWECADEDFKHYQAEDCSWGTPERYELGCVNNTCRSAEVCTPGFKCIDDFRRGYQKEDCSFLSKIDCEWGCDAGKCQEKPTNIFTNATAPASTPPKYSVIAENNDEVASGKKTIYSLKWGEQQQIDISGKTHNVTIHDLKPDKVMIEVDKLESDWLMEKQNYSYANIGVTFTIEAILYQAYAGGKQEIDYSVR